MRNQRNRTNRQVPSRCWAPGPGLRTEYQQHQEGGGEVKIPPMKSGSYGVPGAVSERGKFSNVYSAEHRRNTGGTDPQNGPVLGSKRCVRTHAAASGFCAAHRAPKRYEPGRHADVADPYEDGFGRPWFRVYTRGRADERTDTNMTIRDLAQQYGSSTPGTDSNTVLSSKPRSSLDECFARINKALDEGYARCDSPQDFATMAWVHTFFEAWMKPGNTWGKLPRELMVQLRSMVDRWEAAAQANTKERC